MKKRKKQKKILKFGKFDFIKATKKADREIELAENAGWKAVRKIHKSKKQYNRKENKNITRNNE